MANVWQKYGSAMHIEVEVYLRYRYIIYIYILYIPKVYKPKVYKP